MPRSLLLIALFFVCQCGTVVLARLEPRVFPTSPGQPNVTMQILKPEGEGRPDLVAEYTKINEKATVTKKSVRRNVIVLGKSRVGKTNLIAHLMDPEHLVDEKPNLFYQTKYPVAYPLSISRHGVEYNINIIDTPGFYEQTGDNTRQRTEMQIANLIVQCMIQEITKIDRIYLVFDKTGFLGIEDKLALKLVSDLFQGASHNMKIIVTKAQEYDDTEKEDFLNQLKRIKLPERIKGSLSSALFHGLISKKTLANNLTDALKLYTPRVVAMRETIIDDMLQDSITSAPIDGIIYQEPRLDLLAHIHRYESYRTHSGDKDMLTAIGKRITAQCASDMKVCKSLQFHFCDDAQRHICEFIGENGVCSNCNGTSAATQDDEVDSVLPDRLEL